MNHSSRDLPARRLRRRRTRLTACAVVAAATLLTTLAGSPPAGGAQGLPDDTQIAAVIANPELGEPAADPLGPDGAMHDARQLLSEAVRDVPVSGTAVERLEAEILALESTITTNRRVRDESIAALGRLEGERQALRARLDSLTTRRRAAGQQAAQLRRELGEIAVAAYVGAGDPAPGLTLDPDAAIESGRQRVLMEAVDMTLRDRLDVAETEVASLATQITGTQEDLVDVAIEVTTTTERRDRAIAELARAEPALPDAQQRYSEAFMTAQVSGADFTVVALDAYRTGADLVNAEQPSCRISWTVLAGIGRVESRHGHFGGSTLGADGTTTRRIIGVALDGSDGVMLIPDTDGGALDGDPVYDRAVGPMQFIPSTWRMMRRDGNGNGRMDPHNIYDAAAAAAAYLCRTHSRLDQPASLNQALLTYNRSVSYVNAVVGYSRAYSQLGLPG